MTEAEQRAAIKRWTDRLGRGFHPDTPAADYMTDGGVPSLSDAEQADYTRDMRAAYEGPRDPSEVAIEVLSEPITVPEAMAVLQSLAELFAESHAEEKDAEHYGDEGCSYCRALNAAQSLLDRAKAAKLFGA